MSGFCGIDRELRRVVRWLYVWAAVGSVTAVVLALSLAIAHIVVPAVMGCTQ